MNNRYKHVIDSLAFQEYPLHLMKIIFVDDNSDDGTLEKTRKYIQRRHSHLNVTFVGNKKRMFATFNIYNSIKTYCNLQDIVVLLDGDDELMGTQVLNILNKVYQ